MHKRYVSCVKTNYTSNTYLTNVDVCMLLLVYKSKCHNTALKSFFCDVTNAYIYASLGTELENVRKFYTNILSYLKYKISTAI